MGIDVFISFMWEIERQTFEIRFKNEFLYWDRTGDIALRIMQIVPSLTLESATPGETTLVDAAAGLKVTFSFKILAVIQDGVSRSSIKFNETCPKIADAVIRTTEVKTLTRIGHRLTYVRFFESLKHARDFLLAVAKTRGMGVDLLGAPGVDWLQGRELVDCSHRFENEKTGIRVELNTGTLEFGMSGKRIPDLEPHIPKPKYLAMVDADIYTRLPLAAADLDVEAMLQSNQKLMRTRILPVYEP